jgi:hypothetical protein
MDVKKPADQKAQQAQKELKNQVPGRLAGSAKSADQRVGQGKGCYLRFLGCGGGVVSPNPVGL